MWRNISSPDILIIRFVNILIERLAIQIFETYARDLIKEVSYK